MGGDHPRAGRALIPILISWAGIIRIPTSAFSCRITTCSFSTIFSSHRLQVAYVVDPIRQTRGFFQWRGDAMEATAASFSRPSEANGLRWRAGQRPGEIPDAHAEHGGGLGGLTPRLEAELIAMLSRPTHTQAHAPVSSIDRETLMLAFTVLGAVVGIIALSAVMWLNALNGHVADQTRASTNYEKTSPKPRRAAWRWRRGRRVADELLRKLTRERDKAFSQLADQKTNCGTARRTRAHLAISSRIFSPNMREAKRYEADATGIPEPPSGASRTCGEEQHLERRRYRSPVSA